MSTADFEAFAAAVAAPRAGVTASSLELNRIAVLGGGDDARLLAALALGQGREVTLFSAYGAQLDALRKAGGVTLRGDGPVGTFAVDREDAPSIRSTAELDRAVSDADALFLTGPVHKQRTYAMVLSDHLRDGQVLVLCPGRTFGAAETAWLLRIGGCTADVTIVEVQAPPYWTRAQGSTLHLTRVARARAATLPANRPEVLEALRGFLPHIDYVVNTVHSSFADGSGLVEAPALLLGGPALPHVHDALPAGAVPLEANKTFRALLGDAHIALVEQLADERRSVAAAFGVRDLPGTAAWFDAHAGKRDPDAARPVPTHDAGRAMLRCATVGSLSPLLSAARVAGRATPATEAMVTLASSVLGADVASAGRRLDAMGITAGNLNDARRVLDRIAAASN